MKFRSGGITVWVLGHPPSDQTWVAEAALNTLRYVRQRVAADLGACVPHQLCCRVLLANPNSSNLASRLLCVLGSEALYCAPLKLIVAQCGFLGFTQQHALIHEAVHLFCHLAGGWLFTPFWASEGYASNVADLEEANHEQVLRSAAAWHLMHRAVGRAVSLRRLLKVDGTEGTPETPGRRYLQASLLVAFLRQAAEHAPAAWELVRGPLLHPVRNGSSIKRFQEVFGATLDEIDNRFIAWCERVAGPGWPAVRVKQRYRIARLPRCAAPWRWFVLGIPLVALVLTAWIGGGLLLTPEWIHANGWCKPIPLLSLVSVAFMPVFYKRGERKFRRLLIQRKSRVCAKCGYNLTGLPDHYFCPRCGDPYSFGKLAEYWRHFASQ
jgi:hypothetical protein